MAEIVCPYCFKRFNTYDVWLQCTNRATKYDANINDQVEVCKSVSDQAYTNHWGENKFIKYCFDPNYTGFERFRIRMGRSVMPKPCPKCGQMAHRFVCPHCHNFLPPEMVEKGGQIISVIGGPSSGKTNYIVALIHQLQHYSANLGLDITLQQYGRSEQERTDVMFRNYEKIIFQEHQAVPKTQVMGKTVPWIARIESRNTGKAIFLVFYDTAGEHFNGFEDIEDLKYFKESEACIVVFDTLAIPKIHKILGDPTLEAFAYRDTWNTLKSYQQANKDLNLHKKPFAFTFTKFDAVLDNKDALNCRVEDFTDGTHEFTDSSYTKKGHKVSMDQLDRVSKTIYGYLCDEAIWNEKSFASAIEHEWGNNGHFFGVSALGAMTDEQLRIKSEEVKPKRVLDPLVWILIKLGGFGIPTE